MVTKPLDWDCPHQYHVSLALSFATSITEMEKKKKKNTISLILEKEDFIVVVFGFSFF